MEESTEHRLATALNAKVQDFFLAETISADRPVKFAGEWVNEMEHPRDSKDGLLEVKVSHSPRIFGLDSSIPNIPSACP
jgi:hypothetical protein